MRLKYLIFDCDFNSNLFLYIGQLVPVLYLGIDTDMKVSVVNLDTDIFIDDDVTLTVNDTLIMKDCQILGGDGAKLVISEDCELFEAASSYFKPGKTYEWDSDRWSEVTN